MTLQSPKRRRMATPDDNIDADDDEEDSDNEDEVVQSGHNDFDPVKAMTAMLTKSNIRKLVLKGDHDNNMMRAGSLEIGAVVAHEEKGDLIRANALIDEYGGKTLSVTEFNAMKSVPKTRLWGIIRQIRDLKEEI